MRMGPREAEARLAARIVSFSRDVLACCARSVLDGDPLVAA